MVNSCQKCSIEIYIRGNLGKATVEFYLPKVLVSLSFIQYGYNAEIHCNIPDPEQTVEFISEGCTVQTKHCGVITESLI